MVSPPLLLTMSLLSAPEAETRALTYLAREVPRWSVENKCYSCHHNGDAARALYDAAGRGFLLPAKALADTTAWVSRPDGWDRNGGDGPYNDRRLARLQFAATLTSAVEAGLVSDREPLKKAARRVADQQHADGHWPLDDSNSLGSPATHGAVLATTLARRTLLHADPKAFRLQIDRADAWLRKLAVKRVLDAAAVLLALERANDSEAVLQRRRCLELIRKGESKDGGWGPYTNSAPEVFDSAVVVLALTVQPSTAETKAMLRRGRAWLLATQQKDGSWRETTRPSDAESYPQRLATTGWATLALLATRGDYPQRGRVWHKPEAPAREEPALDTSLTRQRRESLRWRVRLVPRCSAWRIPARSASDGQTDPSLALQACGQRRLSLRWRVRLSLRWRVRLVSSEGSSCAGASGLCQTCASPVR